MSTNSLTPLPKKTLPALATVTSPPLEPIPTPNTRASVKQIPHLSKINATDANDEIPVISAPVDRFKGIKLPHGWIECPLEFSQPLRDYRILVSKTPIDIELAQYLKIPKDKYFAPHTIYTLPNKHYQDKQQQLSPKMSAKQRKIGLVIDLTNQMYYDELAFYDGKKANKVLRRVIMMQNVSKPTEGETSGFVGLVKSFLDSAHNQEKWIVVHDDLGHNLAGFMCAAFMVKELNYSVDAAVHTFSQSKKPGIFEEKYVRLLHEMYSDKEDQEIFEQVLKLKALTKPFWMQRKVGKKSSFAVPTSSIRRKRTFSDMCKSSASVLSEEEENVTSSNIIMEPSLIAPIEVIEPMMKKHKAVKAHVPRELKQDHPYLVAVCGEHLQHLTTIILQLSKNKELFQSIRRKPATIPRLSLMKVSNNYRISWLGKAHMFWLMILGKKGCFFVDPSYFEAGKLGGIYHIAGTQFYNEENREYMDGSLCCGELVVDHIIVNKQSNEKKKVPRFLITDMLVFDKQSLSKFPHTERLMRADNYLCKKFAKSLQKSKLRIRAKPMYKIENEEIINKLQRMIEKELPHKCCGLGLFPIKPPFGQRLLRLEL